MICRATTCQKESPQLSQHRSSYPSLLLLSRLVLEQVTRLEQRLFTDLKLLRSLSASNFDAESQESYAYLPTCLQKHDDGLLSSPNVVVLVREQASVARRGNETLEPRWRRRRLSRHLQPLSRPEHIVQLTQGFAQPQRFEEDPCRVRDVDLPGLARVDFRPLDQNCDFRDRVELFQDVQGALVGRILRRDAQERGRWASDTPTRRIPSVGIERGSVSSFCIGQHRRSRCWAQSRVRARKGLERGDVEWELGQKRRHPWIRVLRMGQSRSLASDCNNEHQI